MKIHLKKFNLQKALQKIIIISACLLVASSCQKNVNTQDNVAMVDGEYITKDLYTRELTFYSSYYAKKYGENYLNSKDKSGLSNYQILEKDLLDSLIKDQVMLNDLNKHDYKINNVEYEKLQKELIKELKNKESLIANVEAINSDELSFSDILYRDSIKYEHRKMFEKINDVKDKEVLDYYKNNKKFHRMYKYNALVFDDKNEAEKINNQIKNNQDFKSMMNKKVRNFDTLISDFVYDDDELLKESNIRKKDQVSKIFEYKDKYYILMINSYNENENDLLINTKKYYLDLQYQDYLKDLIKKSKIRIFV
ncbi:MAG: peptidylprolyl isomerase [Peptoniphilaceae bacterium]|nr:peptidylprolyl isomerase [Peptoniphilaceae bacterium]MDY6019632.1 peptidylprolyl isomerase [Anaerococcus sp.]